MRERVLFVDCEEHLLSDLQRALHTVNDDWEMLLVADADAACTLMAETDVDVVVLDRVMPDADGIEMLQRIQSSRKEPDAPVIVVTDLCDEDFKRRTLDAGAADPLNKPVRPDDLIARIRNELRYKAYQVEIRAAKENLRNEVRARTTEIELSRLEVIWHLAKAGEYRDEGTGNHVVRVGYYCREIARELGLSEESVRMLFLTSPLHDIGKIGIPDGILLKNGPLTPDERTIMQRHCQIGASILLHRPEEIYASVMSLMPDVQALRLDGGNELLMMASTIALSHHERWDGRGYPCRLAGESIPMEARIVAIADVYDALCSVRPYKPAFPEPKALEIIRDENGRHFDPAVYAAFERSLDAIRTTRARLTDQSEADEAQKAA